MVKLVRGDNMSLEIAKGKSNHSALLIGNGFSINFDSEFANIYDRLIEGHKILLKQADLKFNSQIKKSLKKRIQENYKSVLQYSHSFNEETFEELFVDAIKFAKFIVSNEKIINTIKTHKDFNSLTFGYSHLTVADSIYKIGTEKGYKYVNIENWTGLVWLYYILEDLSLNEFNDFLMNKNLFIKLIKLSQVNKIQTLGKEQFVLENFICSGFNMYYKFLMAATIYNQGKAINLDLLENIGQINCELIKESTNRFDILMTLNYDHILEMITSREVTYLHGRFYLNKDFYVYHQLQKLKTNDHFINITDIKIGDFLYVKAMAPIFYNLNAKKFNENKLIIEPIKEISDKIKKHSLNHIVLFGMNVENDYHILRAIMLGFVENNIKNPTVTYCYFTEEEKISFEDTWNKVITFGEEYNDYARNINLTYLDSKEIIKEYKYDLINSNIL